MGGGGGGGEGLVVESMTLLREFCEKYYECIPCWSFS